MRLEHAAIARRMLAVAVGVLAMGAPQTRAAVPAAEPANDHMGGAETIFLRPVSGVIGQVGDGDWYAIDVPLGGSLYATVERTGGPCGPEALHATELNPEGRPFAWHVVRPGEKVTLPMPSLTPGRYYIEVDAAGEPGCAGATYTISVGEIPLTGGGVHTDLHGAACAAARAQVNTDRVMAARFRDQARTKQGATRRRYEGYSRAWAALLRKDTKIVRQACSRG